jgi:UDP-3-O-[3-hydroxymyristoyl] glucosamine N-acyltransferase
LGSYTLAEIASRLHGTVRGDAARRVTGIKPLDQAGPEDLSFVARPRYRSAASESRAAALIVGDAGLLPGRNLIVVENPYAALANAMGLFFAPEPPAVGISPQAVIGEGAVLGEDIAIGPFAVVGPRCVLGARSALLPGVVLGEGVRIGEDSVLHPGVVIYPRSVVGSRVTIHAGSVVGSDGFGYAEEGASRTKIPQVGNVEIGDDVEIGACVTIDRATFGSTLIGSGTKIDNLVQVGHNVVVGKDSILVAQSGIAGSTRLGRSVILAGQAGVAGHLVLGDHSVVGAKSAALRDVAPGAFVIGVPAVDHKGWKREQAALHRLPDLLHRVARLERAAAESSRNAAGTGPGRRGVARAGRRATGRG